MDFFTLHNIVTCILGISVGTLIGVLPSITPSTIVALSLPILSLYNDAATSFIFLTGIIYGSQYGGSTTSIIMNIPGEGTSLMTTIDGYKLTQDGNSKLALYSAGISSFIGGMLSVGIMIVSISFISNLNDYLSAPDFLVITLISCYCIMTLNNANKLHNFQGLMVGFILTYIGEDSFGNYRYAVPGLEDGLSMMVLTVCMFGMAESIMSKNISSNSTSYKFKRFTFSDLYCIIPVSIRSAFIGSMFGIIPFFSQSAISILCYNIERKFFNKDGAIGNGSIRGIAAAESANNASAQTSLIPLLSMGIPSNNITTMVYVSLLSCGITFNPNFKVVYPELYDTFIYSIIFGNIMLLLMNTLAINFWIKILKIPSNIINPVIIMTGVTIVYSMNNSPVMLISIAVLCILGIIFKYTRYSYLPIIIGFLLGKQVEEYTYRTIKLFNHDWSKLLEQPLVLILTLYIIFVMLYRTTTFLTNYRDKL